MSENTKSRTEESFSAAGGPLLTAEYKADLFLTWTEITGGAPLLALFEKWPAGQPTPFDSALRGRKSDLHRIDSSISEIQLGRFSTSRGLGPSAAPTMPSRSMRSIRCAARP